MSNEKTSIKFERIKIDKAADGSQKASVILARKNPITDKIETISHDVPLDVAKLVQFMYNTMNRMYFELEEEKMKNGKLIERNQSLAHQLLGGK